MIIELGLSSPVHVSCVDRMTDLSDFLSVSDVRFLKRFFKKYNSQTRFKKCRARLEYLDRRVDIPLVELYFHPHSYPALCRVIQNKCTKIPVFVNMRTMMERACQEGHVHILHGLSHPASVSQEKSQKSSLFPKLYELGIAHLDIIHYLYKRNCKANWEYTCQLAVNQGQLECAKFIYEKQGHANWLKELCFRCIISNQCECLHYFHELTLSLIKDNDEDNESLLLFSDMDVIYAISNNSLKCLRYMVKHGAVVQQVIAYMNAGNSSIEIIYFLFHECGIPISPLVYESAIEYGRLDIIQYVHEQGCVWEDTLIHHAYNQGNRAIILYLLRHDPWSWWSSTAQLAMSRCFTRFSTMFK